MKTQKIIAVLASISMCIGIHTLSANAANIRMSQITMIGDANNSGSIEVADIIKLQKYLLTKDKSVSMNADLNGDGIINVFDLVLMKRVVLGTYQPEDYTKLIINEVCASNGASLVSADGSSPDWIEIYNGSETDIHLGGYGLSDGTKKLFKYTFPSDTIIKAGEYLTVLCDGDGIVKAGNGEYLAPFNISNKKSETIYLTHPKNGTLDTVTLPIGIKKDTTYGRYQNKGFKKLSATPNDSNDSAVVTLDSPVFSANGGFYDIAFNLSLSGTDGTVYYTLDNTDPRTSGTAVKFDKAINIYDNTNEPNVYSAVTDISCTYDYIAPSKPVDKGVIVRAVVKDSDGNFSDVVSQSYFVGKDKAYYKGMKVISLVTDPDNLFDAENGIYVTGGADSTEKANFWKKGKEAERPASIQVFQNGKSAYTADIGIRVAGGYSRDLWQKSIRLYARSTYGTSKMNYPFIDGLTDVRGNLVQSYDKLTLRSGGNDNDYIHVRDEVIQSLVPDRDFTTQGTENCIVFLDGEFWGLYTMTEKYDEDFIETHYGITAENVVTFKVDTLEDYTDEAKAQEILSDLQAFGEWILTADMSNESNYERACKMLDMQSFIDYMATETYINNTDNFGSVAMYVNNWEIWRAVDPVAGNSYEDGKWRFMLFDTDNSANYYAENIYQYGSSPDYDSLNAMSVSNRWNYFSSWFVKLMENAIFRNQFYSSYLEIIETNFAPEHVHNVISAKMQTAREALIDTRIRYGITQKERDTIDQMISADFDWNELLNDESAYYDYLVGLFENYFEERPAYAKAYLGFLFGEENISVPTSISMSGIKVSDGVSSDTLSCAYDQKTDTVTAVMKKDTGDALAAEINIEGFKLKANTAYEITFEIKCDIPESHIGMMTGGDRMRVGFFKLNQPVSDEWRTLTMSIPCIPKSQNGIFCFYLGEKACTYTIRNVTLHEITP